MTPASEIRIELPHIELAARVHGPEDGLPVLALHGWLDNAATFDLLAPRLPGLRIVALDMAGHGHSDHRPLGYDYALWQYVLEALMVADHLGWERFSLMGHSLGAIVSTLLAASMPERVERLALVDGMLAITRKPDAGPAALSRALAARLEPPRQRKAIYPSREKAVAARMNGLRRVSHLAASLLIERGTREHEGGFIWNSDSRLRWATPISLDDQQASAFVRAVRCPTSLVIAQDGIIHDYPLMGELAAEMPFAVHTLPGGHHLHLDDPAGADAVADCFKALFLAP